VQCAYIRDEGGGEGSWPLYFNGLGDGPLGVYGWGPTTAKVCRPHTISECVKFGR
jgi:hypothetical protein